MPPAAGVRSPRGTRHKGIPDRAGARSAATCPVVSGQRGVSALALVPHTPPGVGVNEAQAPRLPACRHASVRAAVGIHLKRHALLINASLRRWNDLCDSNGAIVQELRVVTPGPSRWLRQGTGERTVARLRRCKIRGCQRMRSRRRRRQRARRPAISAASGKQDRERHDQGTAAAGRAASDDHPAKYARCRGPPATRSHRLDPRGHRQEYCSPGDRAAGEGAMWPAGEQVQCRAAPRRSARSGPRRRFRGITRTQLSRVLDHRW